MSDPKGEDLLTSLFAAVDPPNEFDVGLNVDAVLPGGDVPKADG